MQSSAALVASARENLAERSDVPAIIKAGEVICKHLSQVFEEQGLHKKRTFWWNRRLSLGFTYSNKLSDSKFSSSGYSWRIGTNIFGRGRLKWENISICSDYNQNESHNIGNSVVIKYPLYDFGSQMDTRTLRIPIDNHDTVESVADSVARCVVREALRNGWKIKPVAPAA